MKKLIGLSMLLVFAGTLSYAAKTDPVNGTAKAKIVEAVTLTHATADALNFGIIVKPGQATTVTVGAAASNPSVNDGDGVQHVGGETISSDKFTVSGLGDAQYAVNLPTSAATLNGSVSGSMTVDTFTTNAAASGNTASEFYIGGTLHIGAAQPVGEYTGSYPISITY